MVWLARFYKVLLFALLADILRIPISLIVTYNSSPRAFFMAWLAWFYKLLLFTL